MFVNATSEPHEPDDKFKQNFNEMERAVEVEATIMSRRYSNGLLHEEETKDLEKGWNRVLQDERLSIQTKTFTAWMNSFLSKSQMEVKFLLN